MCIKADILNVVDSLSKEANKPYPGARMHLPGGIYHDITNALDTLLELSVENGMMVEKTSRLLNHISLALNFFQKHRHEQDALSYLKVASINCKAFCLNL